MAINYLNDVLQHFTIGGFTGVVGVSISIVSLTYAVRNNRRNRREQNARSEQDRADRLEMEQRDRTESLRRRLEDLTIRAASAPSFTALKAIEESTVYTDSRSEPRLRQMLANACVARYLQLEATRLRLSINTGASAVTSVEPAGADSVSTLAARNVNAMGQLFIKRMHEGVTQIDLLAQHIDAHTYGDGPLADYERGADALIH